MNDVALNSPPSPVASPSSTRTVSGVVPADDPLWYKDAIIYELHVRAFCDSNGDGIGDFPGLTEKLDYLRGLGVTALWLLPFYPSPLRDDGYDIAEYFDINPAYGTLKDFKRFLRKAHDLGMRVITELVVNHTSNEHAWFQRARRAPAGSKLRDFYVWSDTSQRYKETRIIFKDFENSNWSWDPVANAYYWHRFYSHQPDLNFDNPAVHEALLRVVDFWLGMGVDGMRLDAVPYLYEREGTNCENLPETHAFLRKLRSYIDSKYGNRLLLAEANQWPEDAAAYFGKGDECHMNFHFPLMPRIFMSLQLEDSFPIRDILEQTPTIPETCQWATFLRNHDELTLEMVTDEDRDYMYRVYANDPRARINLGIRRRLAPLLRMRRKVELLNSLLFSLPGTPVLYYGDEIGMGDNIFLGDRNGVRTPMQWSADRNAGFSRANPQQLYLPVVTDPDYHYAAYNVEASENNPESLLWWMKRLIDVRRRHVVLGRGDISLLQPENPKVLAFVRRYQDQRLLVVANLSRSAQYVELDLKEYAGLVPVELFSRQAFPAIREQPLLLTFGPHDFYWFSLEPMNPSRAEIHSPEQTRPPPTVEDLCSSQTAQKELANVLPAYLKARRWFRSKARAIVSVSIADAIPLGAEPVQLALLLVHVDFRSGDPETYLLPVAMAKGEEAWKLLQQHPQAAIVHAKPADGGVEVVLYDAVYSPQLAEHLLELFARRKELPATQGSLRSSPMKSARSSNIKKGLSATVSNAEQSNTSLVFDGEYICKLFRRLDRGINPEIEIGRVLGEQTEFTQSPALLGAIEYQGQRQEAATLATLQRFMPHQSDAWSLTRDALQSFYEKCLALPAGAPASEHANGAAPAQQLLPHSLLEGSLLDKARSNLPEVFADLAGVYPAEIRLLGQRTAELHRALAASSDPQFTPEPFNTMYQRSLYESTRTRLKRAMAALRRHRPSLSEHEQQTADELLARQGEFDAVLRKLVTGKLDGLKIRVHGDYHLGQVLFTGKDFIIIDFEGEPGRTLAERRFKHCALRDVASMARSLDYAALSALRTGAIRADDVARLEPWARAWSSWMSASFVQAYLSALDRYGSLVPASDADCSALLDYYLLDKCLYELEYEFNNRPDWISIPLFGLVSLLPSSPHAANGGGSASPEL
jgi:maltose alpha-D-glucosyltransferase/alpha-amylase